MFTFGADPEIFVRKGGKAASAHGLVSGTKASPLKTERGAVQVDGMALEFNIDPSPQGDFEAFNLNIVKTIAELKAMVKGYSFNIAPVQDYTEEFLAEQPEEAKELGCDPDYNAYTLLANPRPDGDRPFRTGAGHVHIGWGADIPVTNQEHVEICAAFVKMCDATVGMFMTMIDREPRRRELYGKAGAFRPKPYGVEYRTPSNVWIKNRDRRLVMHHMLNQAINYMTKGMSPGQIAGGLTEADIQDIINTGNIERADQVVKRCIGYGNPRNAYDRIVADIAKGEKPLVEAA